MKDNKGFLNNTLESFYCFREGKNVVLIGTDKWAEKAISDVISPKNITISYFIKEDSSFIEKTFMGEPVKDFHELFNENNKEKIIILICGNNPFKYVEKLEKAGFDNYYSYYLFTEFFINRESRWITLN